MKQITKEDLHNVYEYAQCYESTSGTQGKELVDYCLESVNKIIIGTNNNTISNDILDNLDVIVAEHENVYKMLMTNFATALMDVVTATDDTTAKESAVMLEVYSKQLNKFVLDLIANQQHKS